MKGLKKIAITTYAKQVPRSSTASDQWNWIKIHKQTINDF